MVLLQWWLYIAGNISTVIFLACGDAPVEPADKKEG